MEHEYKWFSWRRLGITLGLAAVLALVIMVELSLFISGPALRYKDKITTQESVITKQIEDIEELNRHVFSYVIYSGHDEAMYYWFNEQGELLTKRAMEKIDLDKAKAQAEQEYGIKDGMVSIGYGYQNPVYIIENGESELYLDVDTMKQVFYRFKGGNV